MDIHKPKPWRGWPEFVKEIGTIVFGVLIALGAEQAVERIHRQGETTEAKQALATELSYDLAAFDMRLAQGDCVERRLDDLDRWLSAWSDGGHPRLTGRIIRPAVYALRTSVWRVASSAAVAHMPFEDQTAYGRIYDSLSNQWGIIGEEKTDWNDLSKFGAARTLDGPQLLQIRRDIDDLRDINRQLRSNGEIVHAHARRLRLTLGPLPASQGLAERTQALCQPVFAS
jgi:hypothetical protein